MQPFQFGLATLLRIRQRMEERAKNELLDQQRRVHEQEKEIRQLLADRQAAEAKAKAAGQAWVDLAMEKSCADYIHTMGYRIEAARKKLQQLEAERDRLREQYIQAQQSVKILDKLKEKRYQEYLKDARRQEQLFLDEVAVSHFQTVKDE